MQEGRAFAITYDDSQEVVIASQAKNGQISHKFPRGRRPANQEEALRLQTIITNLVEAVIFELGQLV